MSCLVSVALYWMIEGFRLTFLVQNPDSNLNNHAHTMVKNTHASGYKIKLHKYKASNFNNLIYYLSMSISIFLQIDGFF